ncbi:MAG: hypothetical protein ACJ763_14545 [Bdellovibrionia bacterium]
MKFTFALIAAFSMALFASCSSAEKAHNPSQQSSPAAGAPVHDAGTEKPVCANAGTRSEGWMFQGRRLKFSNCSGQIAQCEMQGTRSEGWYAYRKSASGSLERTGLIQFASCSGK